MYFQEMTWRALVDLNQGNRGLRLYAREQLAGSLGCLAELSITSIRHYSRSNLSKEIDPDGLGTGVCSLSDLNEDT